MFNIDIFEDPNQVFHYVSYQPGVPNSRSHSPTVCGMQFHGMGFRRAAQFNVGDPRGAVHFVRACIACIQGVSDMFDREDS